MSIQTMVISTLALRPIFLNVSLGKATQRPSEHFLPAH